MKKILIFISVVLLSLTALNAITAGVLFIVDPTGHKMGLSLDYITSSPFESYLIPGIVLLVINGIMNAIAVIATLQRKSYYPYLIMLQGVLLGGWILIQVLMVNDISWLHIIMFSIGLILVIAGWLLGQQTKKLSMH